MVLRECTGASPGGPGDLSRAGGAIGLSPETAQSGGAQEQMAEQPFGLAQEATPLPTG